MNQVQNLQHIARELLYLGMNYCIWVLMVPPSIQIVFANLTQKFFACPKPFSL